MIKIVPPFAASDVNTYIAGETGVGKEMIARRIHCRSERKNHAFIVVDCSMGNDDYLEGEIFGALAATTKTRRSASIIARSFCVVSVLPHNEYLELLKTHPNTVNELMASMARIIVSQNEKIRTA